MGIYNRVEKIRDYFLGFNILTEDNVSVLTVKFPEGWTIPNDNGSLMEAYHTDVGVKNGAVYFVCEAKYDTDCLFDCVEYVIDFNKNVEERKGLFNEAMKELSHIFATEPIERLKTLQFHFPPQKKTTKKTTAKKTAAKSAEETDAKDVEEKDAVKEAKTIVKNNDGDSSLMTLAKNLTGE